MFEDEIAEIYQRKKRILAKAYNSFLNSSSYQIKIGCELEFFLCHKNGEAIFDSALLQDFIKNLEAELLARFSVFDCIEKERGISQIEIKTIFTADILKIGDEIDEARKFISEFSNHKNFLANYKAQPFEDDCGNALQFNISMHCKDKGNIFIDKKFREKIANKLLQATDYFMIFMAPHQESYQRFNDKLNRQLFVKGKFSAPINLSFGSNNRTCAIRFAKGKSGTRLEYRVPCAEADSYLVLAAILSSVCADSDSIAQNFCETFGNAFDEQYNLKSFCNSLDQAKQKFFSSENFLRDIFF